MTKVIPPYDWTFTSHSEGILAPDFRQSASLCIEADHVFDKTLLLKRDPIVFSMMTDLYEDEMGDNGTSMCNLRIVSISMNYSFTFSTINFCCLLKTDYLIFVLESDARLFLDSLQKFRQDRSRRITVLGNAINGLLGTPDQRKDFHERPRGRNT